MTPWWISKKAVAWSLYDFADTAFSALFITFFFPILISVHLGGNEFHIGLVQGASVLVAALLVPLIGALSDATGRRIPILMWAALATAIFAVSAGYSLLYAALLFGFLANVASLVAKSVYNAMIVDIVPRPLIGSLSGLGVGIGYLGTITSLAIAYFLFSYFGWESIEGIQAAFWEAGIFYIIFSLPIFFLVADSRALAKIAWREALTKAIASTKHTILSIRQFPVFAHFLAASFFYNNGMNTAIIFLALYAREVIGIGVQDFFPIFAGMAASAAVGSLFVGRYSDRLGPLNMLPYVLAGWIIITLVLIFVPSYGAFLATGIVGGALLGAVWTLNRHVVALVSPDQKIGEFFGFSGLTERFSGLLGPVVFGFLAAEYGYTPALFSVIVFLVIGLFLLFKTKKIAGLGS